MSEKLGRRVTRLFDVTDVTAASLAAFPEANKPHCIVVRARDHYVEGRHAHATKQQGLAAGKDDASAGHVSVKKGAPESFTFALDSRGRSASSSDGAGIDPGKIHELKLWLEALLPAHLLGPLLLDLARYEAGAAQGALDNVGGSASSDYALVRERERERERERMKERDRERETENER